MKTQLKIVRLFSLLSLLFVFDHTFAAETGPKKKLERGAALISANTNKLLTRVHDYISKSEYDKGLELLAKLETSTSSKKVEFAQVMHAYGILYAQKNDLNNSEKYLIKSLETEALPEQVTISTMYMLGQIQIGNGKYKEGVATIKDWFDYVESPAPNAYLLLATGFAELKQYNEAITNVNTAIKIEKEPKEQWLKFLTGLYFAAEKFKDAVPVLEGMVEKYPNEGKYWAQLSVAYYSIENLKKALIISELAYKKGVLKEEKDIMNLVHLYLANNIPFKAGKVLDKAMTDGVVKPTEKTYRVLSNAWRTAQELQKAAETLGKAAELYKTGDLYSQQGSIYIQMRDWKAAKEALNTGLKLGNLKKTGNVYLALGMAELNLENIASAKKSFNQATKFEESKEQAARWVKYIELEKASM